MSLPEMEYQQNVNKVKDASAAVDAAVAADAGCKEKEVVETILRNCYCGAETNGKTVCDCFNYRKEVWNFRKSNPTSEYKHQVETCPCGVCHTSRVDSGTQDAYTKKFNTAFTSKFDDTSIKKAPNALSGGSDIEFAKNIFSSIGTPYDSKCPHGMPFYACMPCSH